MLPASQRIAEINPFFVMSLLDRAKKLESQGKDIVHLEIGEPDFESPRAVTDAGIHALQSGVVKYTPAAGLPELRQAIADFYKRKYQLNIAADRIFVTPGATGALLLALALILNRDDQVLMADPSYPCNRNLVRLFDARAKLIPVKSSDNYQLTSGLVRRHWEPKCRMALIASPSNPTGTLIDRQELREICGVIQSFGGYLVSDEIYHGLEYELSAVSALTFSDQVLVVNSFSKYFGMTGWRVGWLVVPKHLAFDAEKLAQNIFISAASHSQYAALASFDQQNLSELERRRQEFKKRRDYLCQQLTKMGFDLAVKPGGAFYIYANCSAFGLSSWDFAERLLEQCGVAITPGKDFGLNAPDAHLRFAYTNCQDQLEVAMERLQQFIRTI